MKEQQKKNTKELLFDALKSILKNPQTTLQNSFIWLNQMTITQHSIQHVHNKNVYILKYFSGTYFTMTIKSLRPNEYDLLHHFRYFISN